MPEWVRPDEETFLPEQRRATREVTAGIEREIEDLHVLSFTKRAGELFFFGGLYAGGVALVLFGSGNIFFTVIGILAMGIAFNSLGILIHDGLHGLLAREPALNRFLSFLIGLPILMSASAYKETHSDHHWFLGRKPDYGTYKQHVNKPALVWSAYFLQLLFGSFIYVLLIPVFGFRAGNIKSRILIIIELLAIAAIAYTVATNVPVQFIVLCWVFPILVMNVMTNIRGLASHALSNPDNIYLSSRTITCSPLISFLFLHENFHLEHHIFPGIPTYNLKATHRLIWDRLPEALHAKSYLTFLIRFLKAGLKNDLSPLGVVYPKASPVQPDCDTSLLAGASQRDH